MELELLTADGAPMRLPVELGEVVADAGSPGVGEELMVLLRNAGTMPLANLAVGLQGRGARTIQLAVDNVGPGVWAAAGEPILPAVALHPGQTVGFWMRPVFDPSDVADLYKFEIVVQATSLGED